MRVKTKIAFKSILLFILIAFIIMWLDFITEDISSNVTSKDFLSQSSAFDSYQNKGDYIRLRESLILSDSYGEEYEPYREISSGHELMMDYKVWIQALKQAQSETDQAQYKERAVLCREKLLSIRNDSPYSQNYPILDHFLEEMDISLL